MNEAALPPVLAETREDFRALGVPDRLQLLLDFSNELPDLPERYIDHPELSERVEECQSPVYLFVDVENDIVQVHATAPAESPTTRGFASIIVQGVSGCTVAEVLDIPGDYPQSLGLGEAVSPLRVRGMTGMLARVQRLVRERVSAND